MRQFRAFGLFVMALVVLVGCPREDTALAAGDKAGDIWGCLYTTTQGVYWLPVDGLIPETLVTFRGDDDGLYAHAISPDGTRLAVVTGGYRGEIIDLATGQRTTLWTEGGYPGDLAWSPRGNEVAAVEDGALHLITATGQKRTLVTDKHVSDVAWSPDGATVAYGRRNDKDVDLGLYVIPASGGKPRRLVKGTGDVYGVSDITWSPDGSWIAFLHAWEGGALCFVRPDGTGYRKDLGAAWLPVTGNGLPPPDPINAFLPLVWLQDSSALIYQAMENEMETLGIYRCTPTGDPEPVLRHPNVSFDVLPGGLLLAIFNSPDGSAVPVRVRVLPAPDPKAAELWSQGIEAAYITGLLQPEGKYVALAVQDEDAETSLWMGAVGQPVARQLGQVERLLGWMKQPAR